MSDSRKRLYRSDDRVIAGVIGGFAEYFDVEPTIFRLAIVFLVVATGIVPGVITYIVAVLIMPKRSDLAGANVGGGTGSEEEPAVD